MYTDQALPPNRGEQLLPLPRKGSFKTPTPVDPLLRSGPLFWEEKKISMNKKTAGRILLGTLLPVLLITGIVIGQNQFGAPKSVVHVVTLKWKKEATPAQRQQALDGVRVMAGKIPGIRNIWIKTLKVQGPSADMPFDAAFVMEFADEAALKAYVDHPAHRQWEAIYLPIRESSRTHDITN